MCYLVAKNINKPGCVAIKTKYGKELAEWKKSFYDKVDISCIQLVTISRPVAYGEYAPYRFAHSKEEFERIVTSEL